MGNNAVKRWCLLSSPIFWSQLPSVRMRKMSWAWNSAFLRLQTGLQKQEKTLLQFLSHLTKLIAGLVSLTFNLCCSWLVRDRNCIAIESLPLLHKRRGKVVDKVLGRRQLGGSGLGGVSKQSYLHGLPKAITRLYDFWNQLHQHHPRLVVHLQGRRERKVTGKS